MQCQMKVRFFFCHIFSFENSFGGHETYYENNDIGKPDFKNRITFLTESLVLMLKVIVIFHIGIIIKSTKQQKSRIIK